MNYLPDHFVNTIKSIHKEKGETWLQQFDYLKCYCEEKWECKILEPYELSYNFVAPAVKIDGSFIVVKLVVPNGEGFKQEVEALRYFQGKRMVKLLDVEVEKGIMILEHISPGEKLYSLPDDEEATLIMASIMKKLWIESPPVNSSFVTIFQREEAFKKIRHHHKEGIGPITVSILADGEEIFSKLTSSIEKLFLLHGDLHHHNVLSANDHKWLVIDPKGFIGEKEYDTIQFLLNKVPSMNLLEVTERRINILVEQLDLNKERIILWGFCHSILSLYWSIEDFGKVCDDTWRMFKVFECLKQKKLSNK
ncbi:MAG TPA: aminoglycoside phosphotransferase family protein [Metabacillus sp.]|nr:aminoglycoside phosphotransferase family protein [Metabacillus sp.]